MSTAGIIGGVGPESTIDYYRSIIASYRERAPEGAYPSVVINSIDVDRVLALAGAERLLELRDYLIEELTRLAGARVDFAALAANTPHIVFGALRAASPVPLISIVEVTRDAALRQGLKRVGLFGTRFTMQAGFYPDAFEAAGIEVVRPDPAAQAYIHDKYVSELIKGAFVTATRDRLLGIVERMKAQEGIDGLVLGGTELPLILRAEEHTGVRFLDTTRLHVDAIVSRLLS